LLIELVHIDLEFRFKNGDPKRVEDYLRDYPELTSDRAAIFGLISAEYSCAAATAKMADEYCLRFPDYRNELPGVLCSPAEDTLATSEGSRSRSAAWRVPGYEIIEQLGRRHGHRL
jgi:hypothetical protein